MERCPQVLQDSSMIRFNDHHISLSRTVPVQYHWIQPLTTSLMESINNHKRYGNINSASLNTKCNKHVCTCTEGSKIHINCAWVDGSL